MNDDAPRLSLRSPDHPHLERAFDSAVSNIVDRNIVPGRGPHEPPFYIRAGAGYQEPWTRDAAINTLQAGAFLCPGVARDTLTMVCDRDDSGALVIARDNQWWDSIIWVLGAWRLYLVTGDADFLAFALGVGDRSLADLRTSRFDHDRGLFLGPAVMQDGITGYPSDLLDLDRLAEYSFVLDHPGTDQVACLSTNFVYLRAHRELLTMATELDRLARPGLRFERRVELVEHADALAKAIEQTFWDEARGTYDFLVYPDGRRDHSQEGMGLALAIQESDDDRASTLLASAHRQPRGVANLWPHVQGYDDERPGRHNVLLWPMVMGFWAQAAARTRDTSAFGQTLEDMVSLVTDSGFEFFETYDAVTGAVHGGWQTLREWASEPHQTWSAGALIGAVVEGLLGLRLDAEGLIFHPLVPPGTGRVSLRNMHYRDATIAVDIAGEGSTIRSIRRNGTPVAVTDLHVPADATGPIRLEIGLG